MIFREGRDSTLDPAYFSTMSESSTLIKVEEKVNVLEEQQGLIINRVDKLEEEYESLAEENSQQSKDINNLTEQLNNMVPIPDNFIKSLSFTEANT